MADMRKYVQRYTESLQKDVPEPIEAIAMLSRSGQVATDALYFASPLASMLKGRGDKQRAGGLPARVAVALTPSSIYLFDYRPRGAGIKVKGAPTVWRRDGVRMTPTGAGHCDGVLIELLDTGELLQLENTALLGLSGLNGDFYARLGAPAT